MPLRITPLALIAFVATAAGQPLQPPVRLDRHGDPLPPGAIARLGTSRLRYGGGFQPREPGVEFSSDGKALVTACPGSGLRLWDADSGKLLAQDETALASNQLAVASDGSWIAAHSDGGIVLWEPRTGRRVLIPFDGHPSFVHAIAFAPGGRRLAVSVSDHPAPNTSVRVLDVPTGRELLRLQTAGDSVNHLTFSSDGLTLVCLDWRFVVHLDDAHTGQTRQRIQLPYAAANSFRTLALTADASWLVLQEKRDDPPTVWNLGTGERQCSLDCPPGDFTCAVFLPGGRTLATLVNESDRSVFGLWDPATGKRQRQLILPADIRKFRLTPDGRTAAIFGGSSSVVRLCDTTTVQQRPLPEGHEFGPVSHLAVAPDGRWAVSADRQDIRAWDLADGRLRWSVAGGWCAGLAALPDGRSVVAASDNGSIVVRSAATGVVDRTVAEDRPGRKMSTYKMALSADGQTAISYMGSLLDRGQGIATTIRFDDVGPKRSPSRDVLLGNFYVGLLDPEGRWCTGARPGYRRPVSYNFATGKERPLFSPIRPAGAIAVAPDGRTIVGRFDRLPTDDGPAPVGPPPQDQLCCADTLTGREVWSIRSPTAGAESYFSCVEFAPDQRTIAACTEGKVLLCLDAATGRERLRFGHLDSPVSSLAFTSDGSRLVSGHYDSTILVWDVSAATRREPAPPATAAQLDAWLTALEGTDAAAAYAAVCGLADVPGQSVPLVQKRLALVEELPAERLRQWIADLDSPRFTTRETAGKQIAELGEVAEPALRKALAANPSPEQRLRLQALLDQAGDMPSAPVRLAVRGVWVLERAGTPEATQVIEGLVGGPGESRLTHEAHEALARLRRSLPK